MIYVLDTCVVSETVKPEPSPAVLDWLRAQDEERLYLSVLTLGELQKGIAKLPDSGRRRTLQNWVDWDLRQRFEGRLLDVTPEIALRWGEIQGLAETAGRKMPVIDGLLAATALVHRAVMVTRNTADMARSGVELLDPWHGGAPRSWEIHQNVAVYDRGAAAGE